MIIVLDASVAIKWFNKEEFSDIALKLREEFYNGKHEIVVPDLILYEVSNALVYNKEFSAGDISMAINSIIDMELTINIPSKDLLEKSIEIARKEKITLYDAVYIGLTREIYAKFVTADDKLGKIKGVLLLKDFFNSKAND